MSSEALLTNVKILSPGSDGIYINNVGSSIFSLQGSTIDATQIGINVEKYSGGGQFEVSGNIVSNCSNYPMKINLSNLGTSIFSGIGSNTFANNKFNGNNLNSIALDGNLITNLMLTETNVGYFYKKTIVLQSLKLSIEQGVILRADLLGYITDKIVGDGSPGFSLAPHSIYHTPDKAFICV